MRKPTVFLSLFTVGLLICMLFLVISIFKDDALGGAMQMVLLVAAAIVSAIGAFYCKISWTTI